ncbi:hypothetical protein A9P79_25130 [Cupriavidus taiwanensis]|nr:hypothetical protein A9P79_25130 [Cupriavidus taiwanensis]
MYFLGRSSCQTRNMCKRDLRQYAGVSNVKNTPMVLQLLLGLKKLELDWHIQEMLNVLKRPCKNLARCLVLNLVVQRRRRGEARMYYGSLKM